MISGLHAIETLLVRGLFQEQGMIQRALDEIGEDIGFLSLGVICGELTQRHEEYLDYFYAEEFHDPSDIMGSHTSRGMVGRKKIRAYLDRAGGINSGTNGAGEIIAKAYSGFVHAASPHIMDMYGGAPPRFDVSGEFRSLRSEEHAADALNYFLRALFSMAFARRRLVTKNCFQKCARSQPNLKRKCKHVTRADWTEQARHDDIGISHPSLTTLLVRSSRNASLRPCCGPDRREATTHSI